MGHSRGAASMHYEVARNEAKNSAHMTLLINKDLYKFSSEQPRAIQQTEQPRAIQQTTSTSQSTNNNHEPVNKQQPRASQQTEQPRAIREAAVTSASIDIAEEESNDEMEHETHDIAEDEKETNEEDDDNDKSEDEMMSLEELGRCASQENEAAGNSLPTAG